MLQPQSASTHSLVKSDGTALMKMTYKRLANSAETSSKNKNRHRKFNVCSEGAKSFRDPKYYMDYHNAIEESFKKRSGILFAGRLTSPYNLNPVPTNWAMSRPRSSSTFTMTIEDVRPLFLHVARAISLSPFGEDR